jgi:hypothetical protein
MRRPVAHVAVTADQMQQALTSRLNHTYEPPGTLRDGGAPRHDNDFTDIRDIRIAPTHEELLCPLPPYLPVFLPTAPHHLPVNSMQRHLDIQFRLLREEMMYVPSPEYSRLTLTDHCQIVKVLPFDSQLERLAETSRSCGLPDLVRSNIPRR